MRAILIFILIFFISYSFCSTDFKSRAIHKKNIQPHSKRVEGEWVIKFSKDTPQEIIQKVIERFENESVNIRNKRNIDSRGRIFGLTNIDENLCDSIVDEFFDYVEYYEPNVVVELDVKPNEYNEEYVCINSNFICLIKTHSCDKFRKKDQFKKMSKIGV